MSAIVGCPPMKIQPGVSFSEDSQGAHRKQMPILGRSSQAHAIIRVPHFLCKSLARDHASFYAHIFVPPPARDPRLVRVGSKTESTSSYPLALCGETPQFLFRPYCSLKKKAPNRICPNLYPCFR